MSCRCEQPRRMGRLGRLRGLPLKAGSTIRIGIELAYSLSPFSLNAFSEAVEGCLYQSGGFDSVTVQVTEGAFYVYVLVRGVTAQDFGDPEDVGLLVAGAVDQCGARRVGKKYPVEIDAVPADAVAGGYQGPRATDAIPTTPTPPPGAKKGIFDELFGDSGNTGNLLLIGGLVLAVVLLKK